MSQPGQGKPASSAPVSPPIADSKKPSANGDVRFGAPGGAGTRGK